jgi:predicted amidohydrolase
VIAPDGNKLVEGSTDREEIVTCDIDLVGAPAIPVRRQPKAYAAIAQPTESQPISRLLREPVVPEQSVFRVATLQLDESPNLEAFAGAVHGFLDTLVRQDVQLVILPGVLSEDAVLDAANAGEAAERLRAASAQFGCGLAAALTEYEGARRCRTCFLWDRGDLIGKYRKTHVGGEPYVAGSHLPVFETRFGRLGMMLDDEGLVPEVPRCLMLEGADVILWPARHSAWPLREFARARADENKVYVVLAAPTGGGTAIVNPSGALLAAALPDVEQAVGAQMVWATSHYKEMAPGTHVVWGRLPETYADLTE